MTDPAQSGLRIAIVRFSALGDVVMVSAAVRALQHCLPSAQITWITSPLAHSLLKGMPDVNFEVVNKPRSLADYRAFYRAFRRREFDVVLAMQANLRINLLYPALRATLKIGFDRTRAREGQWLFCNRQIPFSDSHLVDSFLSFAETLTGEPASASWNLPVDEADLAWAREQLHALPKPLVAVHPCASKAERNWLFERYAETVAAAMQQWQCGFVFTGGGNAAERDVCARLAQAAGGNGLDLCGQTTPKQLAALLGEADVLIAPDTAAVHLARAMDTPVVGLYAVASPDLSGPYRQMDFVVNRHPDAVRKFLGRDPDQVAWNTRVHHPDAMGLVTTDDVLRQLGRALQECSPDERHV